MSYDPNKDLAPVFFYVKSPFVLVVKSGGADEFGAELIKYAKERDPDDLQHAGRRLLAASVDGIHGATSGPQVHPVPYRSSPQAIGDIAAGDIDVGFAEAGRLAVDPRRQAARARRLVLDAPADVADVPPFAEAAGMPDFEAVSWHILSRRGPRRRSIDRLHREMRVIMRHPK